MRGLSCTRSREHIRLLAITRCACASKARRFVGFPVGPCAERPLPCRHARDRCRFRRHAAAAAAMRCARTSTAARHGAALLCTLEYGAHCTACAVVVLCAARIPTVSAAAVRARPRQLPAEPRMEVGAVVKAATRKPADANRTPGRTERAQARSGGRDSAAPAERSGLPPPRPTHTHTHHAHTHTHTHTHTTPPPPPPVFLPPSRARAHSA